MSLEEKKEFTAKLYKAIDLHDLHGRSFTLGLAFQLIVIGGIWSEEYNEIFEDIRYNLADNLANLINGSTEAILENISFTSLCAISDNAIVDEIVREFVVDEE